MHTFLFLLRSYPDIDHIAPLMWKALEKGDRALVVFEEPYEWRSDYRLRFLANWPGLRVWRPLRLESPSRLRRAVSRTVLNRWTLRSLLRAYNVSACVFQWGPGLPPSPSPGPRSWVRERFLRNLRIQLLAAATDQRVPTFCLPHGLNMKLNVDINPYVSAVMEANDGEIPFEDRDSFTAYVFNTEYHRQTYLQYARMAPGTSVTWGSLRFCPEWMQIIDQVCPPAALPPVRPSQARVVFFLPKWNNRVDKRATLELLYGVAARTDVQLVLKTHPRPGAAELDQKDIDALAVRPNVVFAGDADSPSLVRDADVVIDIGSSIAMEAVLRGKTLVYPAYLHQNRLVFDEYGGCALVRSFEEAQAVIGRVVQGDLPAVPPGETEAVIRQVVYGGREPFDVPEHYYEQVLGFVERPQPPTPEPIASEQ